MRRTLLMISTLACLLTSAGAAAADASQDELLAPGLYVHFSFGASAPAPTAAATLQDRGFALNETAATSAGLSTGTWVVIGVVAAAVIIAVAAHSSGGGYGGGSGSGGSGY